jgi:hypothetical protein
MLFQLEQATQVLSRTPSALKAMLSGLDEEWLRNNYGPDSFSPFDVVGHLIHGEKTDWMPRVRCILDHGESQPFDPFDRYAMYEASRGRSVAELLTEFAVLRIENLTALAALNVTGRLDETGMHPVLGRVTLQNLLACWTAHDLNHIHQIAKCMAYQYRDEVGPWIANLGVYA